MSKIKFIYAIIVCAFSLALHAVVESSVVSVHGVRWKKFAPASEVYIDTTLQFTAAENHVPSIDPKENKLAIWLNVETNGVTNLCVYASLADLEPVRAGSKSGMRIGAMRGATVTKPHVFRLRGTESIKPDSWYRLTVRTIKDVTRRAEKSGDKSKAILGFQIFLDGNLLGASEPSFSKIYRTYATGTEGWLKKDADREILEMMASGTVFVSLSGESENSAVGSVGFEGGGDIDGVDVLEEAPRFMGISSLDFTLYYKAGDSLVKSVTDVW